MMKISRYIVALCVSTHCLSFAHKAGQTLSPKIDDQPEYIIEKRGNTTNIRNLKSVVPFASSYYPKDSFIDYNGLDDTKLLTDLLNRENYIEVLKHVWSEKNQAKRIGWLTQAAENGHVICMFELFKEWAQIKNYKEMYFWYLMAQTRLLQDIACCNDESVRAAYDCLFFGYGPWLGLAFVRRFLDCLDKDCDMLKCTIDLNTSVLSKLKSLKQYPSPVWVSHHGLGAFLNKKCDLKPANEWHALRKKQIQKLEAHINELKKITDPKTFSENKILEVLRKMNKSDIERFRLSIKEFDAIDHAYLLREKFNELQMNDSSAAEILSQIYKN